MSAVREAIVLPLIFLSVVLAGAIRPGAEVSVVPPPLASLVVAMLLVALLVRSGVLAPDRLMSPSRSMLANSNGLVVLLTLFAASAQVVTLVVPESGVPALVVWIALLAMIAQAFAVATDRVRMLRGLLVTFGAAFSLKFILLASLSAPAENRVARAVQLLFEGITLGAVSQRTPHPAEGYLAFATVAAYLIALAFLPSASWQMIRVSRGELAGAHEIVKVD
jgi:phage shock protein PspC (stress-responsive transcriptional regulator)